MQKQLPAVLVMFIIFITGTKACESNICLSWTLKTHETLKLICRVGFLHYSVKILGPSGEEEAFCFAPVQHSKCDHFSRGFVEQNLKTNETIVTFLHVNSRFNGIWTCEHGVGIGTATTEVLLTSSNGGQQCIWEFLSWTMIGLLPTFIILRITVWIFLNKLKDSNLYKTLTSFCTCDMIKDKRKKSVCKKGTIIFVTVCFFGMPIIMGLHQRRHCIASEAFFIVGAIIAVTFNLMLNESNVTQEHISERYHTPSGNNANNDGNMVEMAHLNP